MSKGTLIFCLSSKNCGKDTWLPQPTWWTYVDVAWTLLQCIWRRTAVPDPSPWSLPPRSISTRQSRPTSPLPGLQLGISTSFVLVDEMFTAESSGIQWTRDVDTISNQWSLATIFLDFKNHFFGQTPDTKSCDRWAKSHMSGLTWGCWSWPGQWHFACATAPVTIVMGRHGEGWWHPSHPSLNCGPVWSMAPQSPQQFSLISTEIDPTWSNMIQHDPTWSKHKSASIHSGRFW